MYAQHLGCIRAAASTMSCAQAHILHKASLCTLKYHYAESTVAQMLQQRLALHARQMLTSKQHHTENLEPEA